MAVNYNVSAQLVVGGLPVPISSFEFDAAAGAIGATVRCVLADPLANAPTGDVTFQVGISAGGGTVAWVTLMDVGRVLNTRDNIEWLGDEIDVTCLSLLADRVDRRPVNGLIVFDPEQTTVQAGFASGLAGLTDVNRNFIFPDILSMPFLDLYQLLNLVYVDHLGFQKVVTNILNFPVARMDFPLTSNFHSVVSAEIAVFEPKFHCDDSNVLWILDAQASLPPGLSARTLDPSVYRVMEVQNDKAKLLDSIVLRYRDLNVFGTIPFPRVETQVTEAGVPGTLNYQRTETQRFINDFKDNPSNPTEVTRSVVTRVVQTTSAVADGLLRAVQIDDQTDLYQYTFQLKVGYVKQTSIYCAVPGESATMRLAQTETNQIVWANLAGIPGEMVKEFEITELVGQVLNTPDDPSVPDGSGTRVSLYDANRQNAITDDMVLETTRAITTEVSYFRETGLDQVEVSIQRINHLTDQAAPELAKTYQHTGTIRVRLGAQWYDANMLLVLPGRPNSDLRAPGQVTAGNVPFAQAKPVALRVLNHKGNQPKKFNVVMAGFDLNLRRGALRTLLDRDNNSVDTFVTGYHIGGKDLGTPRFSVEMSFTADKLQKVS